MTAPLNHPDGATGYRVEFAGKVVAYITDTEHHAGRSDPEVLKLMHHADVAIYDSTYTDEEYPAHRHWGHSTWEEGVRLAKQAGVKQFVIFHHDPNHSDEMMDQIAADAAKALPGTIVAHEGPRCCSLSGRGRGARPRQEPRGPRLNDTGRPRRAGRRRRS